VCLTNKLHEVGARLEHTLHKSLRRLPQETSILKSLIHKRISSAYLNSRWAGYGLDDRQSRKDFSSSLCVQTGSGAHPASYTPGVLPPWLKSGQGVTPTTHPHFVPRSRMSRSCTPLPRRAWVACSVALTESREKLHKGKQKEIAMFGIMTSAVQTYLFRFRSWESLIFRHGMYKSFLRPGQGHYAMKS
jgi:hypothetical protein